MTNTLKNSTLKTSQIMTPWQQFHFATAENTPHSLRLQLVSWLLSVSNGSITEPLIILLNILLLFLVPALHFLSTTLLFGQFFLFVCTMGISIMEQTNFVQSAFWLLFYIDSRFKVYASSSDLKKYLVGGRHRLKFQLHLHYSR